MPDYNNNIPLPDDYLDESQPLMRDNFAAFYDLININHGNFGAADEGKHKWVTFPTQQPVPVIGANEIGVRGILSTFTNRPEMGFNRNAVPGLLSFTVSVPAIGRAWAPLGGNGLFIKTGGGAGKGRHRTDFPVGPEIPRFTHIYAVQVNVITLDQFAGNNLFIAVENFDTLGMNLYTAQRTQVNPALMYYSYVAIGDDLP